MSSSIRVVEEFAPQRVILFGSHARGDATPDSDVDLLVIMPTKKSDARTGGGDTSAHPAIISTRPRREDPGGSGLAVVAKRLFLRNRFD